MPPDHFTLLLAAIAVLSSCNRWVPYGVPAKSPLISPSISGLSVMGVLTADTDSIRSIEIEGAQLPLTFRSELGTFTQTQVVGEHRGVYEFSAGPSPSSTIETVWVTDALGREFTFPLSVSAPVEFYMDALRIPSQMDVSFISCGAGLCEFDVEGGLPPWTGTRPGGVNDVAPLDGLDSFSFSLAPELEGTSSSLTLTDAAGRTRVLTLHFPASTSL